MHNYMHGIGLNRESDGVRVQTAWKQMHKATYYFSVLFMPFENQQYARNDDKSDFLN